MQILIQPFRSFSFSSSFLFPVLLQKLRSKVQYPLKGIFSKRKSNLLPMFFLWTKKKKIRTSGGWSNFKVLSKSSELKTKSSSCNYTPDEAVLVIQGGSSRMGPSPFVKKNQTALVTHGNTGWDDNTPHIPPSIPGIKLHFQSEETGNAVMQLFFSSQWSYLK